MAAVLKVAPAAALQRDTDQAFASAREALHEAVDGLTLLSKADYESADAAFKRVMLAAHDVRQALGGNKPPAEMKPSGSQVKLGGEEWSL